MITVLEVLVFILALCLIGVVVAQKSKSQGMGAGFGGGAEDLFGSRARGMDALLSNFGRSGTSTDFGCRGVSFIGPRITGKSTADPSGTTLYRSADAARLRSYRHRRQCAKCGSTRKIGENAEVKVRQYGRTCTARYRPAICR